MIWAVFGLVGAVMTALLARATLAVGFDYFDQHELRTVRRLTLFAITALVVVFVLGPVSALAFGWADGLPLMVVMVGGWFQMVAIAIEVAILHHVKVAQETRW